MEVIGGMEKIRMGMWLCYILWFKENLEIEEFFKGIWKKKVIWGILTNILHINLGDFFSEVILGNEVIAETQIIAWDFLIRDI